MRTERHQKEERCRREYFRHVHKRQSWIWGLKECTDNAEEMGTEKGRSEGFMAGERCPPWEVELDEESEYFEADKIAEEEVSTGWGASYDEHFMIEAQQELLEEKQTELLSDKAIKEFILENPKRKKSLLRRLVFHYDKGYEKGYGDGKYEGGRKYDYWNEAE